MLLRERRGMFVLVNSRSLDLKTNRPYPVTLEIGSTKRAKNSEPVEKGEFMVHLDPDLIALLRRSDALNLRIEGQTMTIPFNEKSDLIDTLETCYKANTGYSSD